MNIFKLAVISVATILVSTSCKQKETSNEENTTKSQTVTLNISSAATKSVDAPVTGGTLTPIEDAGLFFFSEDGTRVHTFILNSTPTGIIAVTNVPTSATKILVVANYIASGNGSNYEVFGGKTLADCQALSVSVSSLQTETGKGVDGMIMSGAPATIINTTVSPETPTGKADVTITPIVSRIEIKSIGTKTGSSVQNPITGFRLLGIYIPNHYATGTMAAQGTGELVKPEVTNYTAKFPFAPEATEAGYLNDFNATGLQKSIADNVYAYHTFPAVGEANLPSIVLQVDQVTYNDGASSNASYDNGNVQYVTVTNYSNKSAGVTSFEAAKVYSIAAINFGIDNLTNDPKNKPRTVSVEVTVTPWTVEEITPEL